MVPCLVLAGAPGSGKSTTSAALAEASGSMVINLGDLRQRHLRRDWSDANEDEETMSVAIMFATVEVYLAHGYHLILDDLRDADAVEASRRFQAPLVSLVVPEPVLRGRIAARRWGFRDADGAADRNERLNARHLVPRELRFDTSIHPTADIVQQVQKAIHAAE